MTPTVWGSSWTSSPHSCCPPASTPDAVSEQSCRSLGNTFNCTHTHTKVETRVRGQDINMLGIICVSFFLFFSSLVKTLMYSFENLWIWKLLESQTAVCLCSLNHDCLQMSNPQVHPGVKLRLKVSQEKLLGSFRWKVKLKQRKDEKENSFLSAEPDHM